MRSRQPTQADIRTAEANFAEFNRHIAHSLTERGGPTYFAGDRLTIADFVLVSNYLSYAFNEASLKPITQTQAATVAQTPVVIGYIERVKAQIPGYLAVRGAYPV